MDRRRGVQRDRHGDGLGLRRDRDFFRDAGDGSRVSRRRSRQLCRRRVRRTASKKSPSPSAIPTAAPASAARIALAVRRRERGPPRVRAHGGEGARAAAHELEAAVADIEYRDGAFRIGGTDRAIGLFELAAKQPEQRIVLQTSNTVADPTWPNGCHICEVEIDPETGEVEIAGYWSVNDVGRVVNPMIVVGQLEGGAMQGIGQALCERVVYDRESGQPLTGTFLDYALPRATMIRDSR
jgi:CO/xanthine dehydrogenase Mo-binding subunit